METNNFDTLQQNIHNLIILILIFFAVGMVGKFYYLFDLLNHFRPFLIVIFVLFCIWIWIRQYSLRIWLYIVLGIILNVPVAPYVPKTDPTLSSDLHIVHFNLLVNNSNHDDVIQMIQTHKPDLISFQEASQIWVKTLKEKLPQYHFLCHELDSPFGICVATTFPVDTKSVFFIQNPNVPAISLKITIKEQNISLVFVHPKPPFTQPFFVQRNRYFQKLIKRLENTENLIIIGDLNTTQWSPIYRNVTTTLQLKNTLSSFQNTWHTSFPISIFQLDHILISQNINIVESNVLEDIGSDHYPIQAKINIPLKNTKP